MRAIRHLHEQTDYTLVKLLTALDYPKSTYHYHLQRLDQPDKDHALKEAIRSIRATHKDYGYRRIYRELLRRGVKVSENKVQRLIQAMRLQVTSYSRKSRRYNSYKGDVGTVAPNRLNRRFDSSIPRQKIVTDTTEFKYYEKDASGHLQIKKLYLDPYLDLFNREIVSYTLSPQPNKASMLSGLEAAIKATEDCQYRRTFHSDQGWGYQMSDYGEQLKQHKIYQSMSRKGNCLDNSPMENFFGLLKQEMYYGYIYHSYEELEAAIHQHIHYYNQKRMKEKLGWLSPVEYRLQHTSFVA